MPKNSPKLPLDKDSTASSNQSKATRRAEAQRLMREQQKKAKRRTVVIQAVVGVVVVAVVAGIVLFVLNKKDGDDATPGAGGTPPGLTSDGGIVFGTGPVELAAVEDFQCPVCKNFEQTSGDLIKSYRDGDQVSVEYRPIAFLDRSSSTEYSSRALNASMCVLAAKGKDAWLTMHDELYANQPDEGGAGLPNSDLVDMANQAGATGSDVTKCIDDRRYDDWVQQQTSSIMGHDGVTGTPSIFVGGKLLGGYDEATIKAAVASASGS